MMRCLLPASLFAVLLAPPTSAQQLQGRIAAPSASNAWLVLQQARGVAFVPADSVRTGPQGDFSFPQKHFATGFYRLAIHDTDFVDIILDHREPMVNLDFDGIPLKEHLHVIASDENKRHWEYNYVARETQAVLKATTAQRMKLLPSDTAGLAALDSVDRRAMNMQTGSLPRAAISLRCSVWTRPSPASGAWAPRPWHGHATSATPT